MSSILLCLDSVRLDPRSPLGVALDVFDYFFCVLFVLEMLLKVIAWGFIGGKVPFLR